MWPSKPKIKNETLCSEFKHDDDDLSHPFT